MIFNSIQGIFVPTLRVATMSRIHDPIIKPRHHSAGSSPAATRGGQRSSRRGLAWAGAALLHAQGEMRSSSSWAGQAPNFRREIRQSHYRNDPVKYDLSLVHQLLGLIAA